MQNIKDLLTKRQITRPRSVIITSRYFWRKWRPILGNSLAVLIMETRQRCYRNLQTGEVRNWFYATLKELGQTAGFSPKTITSLLKKPHAEKFIHYKPTYYYNPDLGKRVKGKCLFQVFLDDPLIPDDELQPIGQEIHNDVINSSQPTGQKDGKGESLREQPSREKVCNNYSTNKKLNKVIIMNTIEPNGKKEEPAMASMSLLARKRRYPNPEKHEQKYFEISRDLGAESGLLKSVLRSCFIGGIDENAPAIKVIIDAPDRFSMDLLNGKYRGKLIEIASQKYQKPVEIFFVSGRDSEDNCL